MDQPLTDATAVHEFASQDVERCRHQHESIQPGKHPRDDVQLLLPVVPQRKRPGERKRIGNRQACHQQQGEGNGDGDHAGSPSAAGTDVSPAKAAAIL